MKLNAVFLLLTCIQVSAAGIAQKVSISEKDAPLVRIFNTIEKQTGFVFWYESKLIKQTEKVDFQASNAELNDVLKQLFSNLPFTYSIVNKTIVIRNKPVSAFASYTPPPVEVSGKVLDLRSGQPIIGASILVKGTKTGTTSDKNGNFRLLFDAPVSGATLVISFVSYEPKEVKVKGDEKLTIELEMSSESMKDIVVMGIMNRPRANFTGAASSYTAEDLQKVTNSDVLTALKSLDPSFQMPENINLGSDPNALPDVVLRGGNSLVDLGSGQGENIFNYRNNPNVPLFILDGFEAPLQRINDLDMNRIIKVDILKDAAATSIYGSRAANGVIVIETLRPKDGRLRFTYNGNTTMEMPDLTGYNLLNASEKLALEKSAGVYNNNFNTTQNNLDIIYSERMAAVQSGVNTYWLAQPLQTGIGQKHNIYVEGGGNNALYGISATYDHRGGVMKGSGRTNTMANTYLSYRINNFLFRNDLTLSFNNAKHSPYGSFTQYARLNPYWSAYNADGSVKTYLEDIRGLNGNRLTEFDTYDNLDGSGTVGRPANPLYNAGLNIIDKSSYQNITNNFFIQYQATNWLRLTGRFTYQRQNDESDKFLPAQHTSFASRPTFEKGSYTKGYGKLSNLDGMLTADVSKAFGKSRIFGTAGMNIQQTQFNTQRFMVQGFPNPNLDDLILGNSYPDGTRPTGSEELKRLQGFLGNLSYTYDNRFLLDLSYRLDGSSLVGSANRFSPFWSVGTGWNIHEEEMFRNSSWLNRLKLRYSVGYTGSQNFASYLGMTTSQYYTDREYRGIVSTYLLGYGNPLLAWQRTLKQNVGADITLFNRLDLVANYFIEKTEGSIARISTPPSSGFNSYSENIGDVLNKGWEVNARFNIISNPRTRNYWSVFVNAFGVKGTIQKVSNTIEAMNKMADTSLSTRPIIRYANGQSTSAIWAVRSMGIDPASGEEIFLSRDGEIVGMYTPANQTIVGDSRPDVESTFGTSFEFNGIGLNAIFRTRYGGQTYNQTLIERVENVNVRLYNVDSRVAEGRWLKPGDQTYYKGLIDLDGYTVTAPTYATSRFVQDDNLLSLESLSIYYRFSDKFNSRMRLENTRITFYSSEVFRASSIDRERGLDYPFNRTFTLQLQTTF